MTTLPHASAGPVLKMEGISKSFSAKEGVLISNHSHFQPMVILKHFGPTHPSMPKKV